MLFFLIYALKGAWNTIRFLHIYRRYNAIHYWRYYTISFQEFRFDQSDCIRDGKYISRKYTSWKDKYKRIIPHWAEECNRLPTFSYPVYTQDSLIVAGTGKNFVGCPCRGDRRYGNAVSGSGQPHHRQKGEEERSHSPLKGISKMSSALWRRRIILFPF